MKVTIDKVTRIGNESFVHFSTGFGSAVAFWEADAPTVGEFHDVELDVMESTVWGVNAHFAVSNVYSIKGESGSINLTGKIVSIDDETAVFDLAGSLILLEIVGFSGNIPAFIDLKIKKIALFPTRV